VGSDVFAVTPQVKMSFEPQEREQPEQPAAVPPPPGTPRVADQPAARQLD